VRGYWLVALSLRSGLVSNMRSRRLRVRVILCWVTRSVCGLRMVWLGRRCRHRRRSWCLREWVTPWSVAVAIGLRCWNSWSRHCWYWGCRWWWRWCRFWRRRVLIRRLSNCSLPKIQRSSKGLDIPWDHAGDGERRQSWEARFQHPIRVLEDRRPLFARL
jgi:hypothetical protein